MCERPGRYGVVIPFRTAKAGLWAAQREWMQATGPLQTLATRIVDVLDRAEHELVTIESALQRPRPDDSPQAAKTQER